MIILCEARWGWDLSQSACLDSYTGSCGLRILKQEQGSPKKEVGGRLKQDLDKDFLNNLGLHTRTLIQRKLPQRSLVLSCDTATRVLVSSRSILLLLNRNYLTLRFK